MTTLIRQAELAGIILLVACGGTNQAPRIASPLGLETAADSLARQYGYWGDAPGASITVLVDTQVLVRKGYGQADLIEGRATTPTTNFRLASFTKQFTAMAILLVAQDGKLALDDSIGRFLTELPPSLSVMKVRQLLNHTSGLLDYEDLIPPEQTTQVSDMDVLNLLRAHDSTLFVPGDRFAYSNSGYVLLGLIVQQASGLRFADFLSQRVFVPLGMTRTVAFEDGISTIPERAYGYSRREGSMEWEFADQSVTSATLGDGGIYSSVEDLAKWARALDAGKLVRSDLLAQAFTPGRLNDGTLTDYGFGWFLREYEGRVSTHHTGSTTGFRTAIRRLPDQRITVIVLTNRDEGDPLKVADAMVDRVLESR